MADFIDPFETSAPQAQGFVDPFDTPEPTPVEEKEDNSAGTLLKDTARLFVSPVVTGLNAIGAGIGEDAAGGSFIEGLQEGAAKDDFLGAKLSMESTPGKWVEEKLGNALTSLREFSGNQAVDMVKQKGVYSVLSKANPMSRLAATLYEEASPAVKTQIEALAYAGGSAGPEILATIFGGGKANKAVEGLKRPALTEADVLASLEEPAVKPTATPETQASTAQGIDPITQGFTPDDFARLNEQTQGLSLEQMASKEPPVVKPDNNLIEFEKVDPATLRNEQSDLPFEDTSKNLDFKNFASPEQGVDFIKTIPTDMTNPNKGMAAQMDLPGINVPIGQSRVGKGQRGSIMLPGRKELTPEQKAKKLNVDEFTEDFIQRHPQYADRPEVAQQVYQRLNNPIENSYSFREAIDNSETLKAIDKGLGAVSTRIGNISQPILHRMVRYEKNLLQNTHAQIGKVDDFVNDLNALPKNTQALMNNLLLNNNSEGISRVAKSLGRPELIEKYSAIRTVLDDIGADLKSIGRVENLRENYFPRIVTDVEGLKKTLGSQLKSSLEVRLDDARKDAIKRGVAFGPLEESAIIDSFMRNRNAGSKPGFTKERKIDDVSPDLEKFYASPTESLHTYIRSAVSEVETARLFGKDAVRDKAGRIDVENSIGTLVGEKLRSGEITGKQAVELEGMLKSRLGPGNRASNAFLQDMKNISNMGLLGNVMSAITQGGDVIASTYLNGLRPTMMAVVQQLAGKSKVSMKDFGLTDHISEEFVSTRSTAKWLNRVFKASAFAKIDEFGKNTVLNGALRNGQRMVKTPSGLKEFSNRWEKRFGDEFPQLVDDLQNGRKTELTDMYLFSTLSKIQPISKIELPQKYLDMPNGRVVYMLKSFMLKQLDLVRNEAYNKIKEGKTREGLYNLSKLTMVLGLGGATTQFIKDYLLSFLDDREVDFEASDIPMNVLKTFGWSEYVANKVSQGKLAEAAGDVVLPPYKMFDILFQDSIKELDGDDDTEPSGRALNFIPVVGKLLYAYSDKGQEALERRIDREENEE
jgi:hypothetical protein